MNEKSDLNEQRCKPCEGGVDAMDAQRAAVLIEQVPGWHISTDGKSISCKYKFRDFYQTMAFVNAMAWIANREDHHPDFSAGYNYCDVTYTHPCPGWAFGKRFYLCS